MKRLFLFVLISAAIISAVALTATPSYTAGQCKPMVLVCNLSEDYPSIMVGNDETTLMYTEEIGEFQATPLVPVDESGTFYLYEWDDIYEDWSVMYESETEEEYSVTLEDGKILALLITPDNYVETFELSYDFTGYGKVMFANLTESSLAALEVAKKFGNRDTAWIEDLPYYTLSNFTDVASDTYSFFWQTVDQTEEGQYYYYPDAEDNPELKEYSWEKWYLIMVYNYEGGSKCQLIEITPEETMFK